MSYQDEMEFLKEQLNKNKCKILNPYRAKEVLKAFGVIKTMVGKSDEETTVEILEGALEAGDVAIRIVTSNFTAYDTSKFADIIQTADDVDIYPTADDRIKVDIHFQNAYYVQTL